MAEAVVSELAKTAIGLFFDIVDVLISLLPSAPFRIMLSQLSEDSGINVLGYVNYFIPFKFCADHDINAWLACVLAYYVYKYLKSGNHRLQTETQHLNRMLLCLFQTQLAFLQKLFSDNSQSMRLD